MTNYEKMMQEMTPEKMAEDMADKIMSRNDVKDLPFTRDKEKCIKFCADWLGKEVEEDAEM